jgi:hypothetical protein
MNKVKSIVAMALGFAGIAILCVDGGLEILPMQVLAFVMLACALALSGAFRKGVSYER